MKNIVNYYFFIAGLLFCLFALGHATFGHENVLNYALNTDLSSAVKAAIFYAWHIPTGENLIFGVIFLYMAFLKDQSKALITAVTIFAINIARIFIYLGSTYSLNNAEMASTIPTVLIMLGVFTLFYFGIRKCLNV